MRGMTGGISNKGGNILEEQHVSEVYSQEREKGFTHNIGLQEIMQINRPTPEP